MKQAIKITAVITLLFIGCVNNNAPEDNKHLEEFNTKVEIQYVRLPEETEGVICNEVHPTIINTSKDKIVEATIKISNMAMFDSIPFSVKTKVIRLNPGQEEKGISSSVCGEFMNSSHIYEVVGEVIVN